jgi:hypothetical protein
MLCWFLVVTQLADMVRLLCMLFTCSLSYRLSGNVRN